METYEILLGNEYYTCTGTYERGYDFTFTSVIDEAGEDATEYLSTSEIDQLKEKFIYMIEL